jgi:hypothetical protein
LVADSQWVLDALARFEAPLLRFAAAVAGPSHAADVVQDTFLKLCAEDRQKLEGHLAAWLFTVCKNRAIELRRSERRFASMEDVDVQPNPDSGPVSWSASKMFLDRSGARSVADGSGGAAACRRRPQLQGIAQVMNLTAGNVGFILTRPSAPREQLARDESLAVRQLEDVECPSPIPVHRLRARRARGRRKDPASKPSWRPRGSAPRAEEVECTIAVLREDLTAELHLARRRAQAEDRDHGAPPSPPVVSSRNARSRGAFGCSAYRRRLRRRRRFAVRTSGSMVSTKFESRGGCRAASWPHHADRDDAPARRRGLQSMARRSRAGP